MIRIESLQFAYPRDGFHLRVRNFSVGGREKVAVIGPSGSGKTTLLNLIAGISVPEKGKIEVDGIQVARLNDAGRREFRITRMGLVFQDFELMEYLPILDNILHTYRITRALRLTREVRRRAVALAQQMGIGGTLKRYPNDLSQGEKQRAAICRALLTQPKLILADEATGNLDPTNKTRILELLFTSVDQYGATLLAVTHDHDLLSRFDRVVDFQLLHERYTSRGQV